MPINWPFCPKPVILAQSVAYCDSYECRMAYMRTAAPYLLQALALLPAQPKE